MQNITRTCYIVKCVGLDQPKMCSVLSKVKYKKNVCVKGNMLEKKIGRVGRDNYYFYIFLNRIIP